MTLPEAFLERLSRIVPKTMWEKVINSFSEPKQTCFRINSFYTTTSQVEQWLQKQNIPYQIYDTPYPGFFVIEPSYRTQLTHSDLAIKRHIYIQNPSSMLPVATLNPQPNEHILDLTAAPGSKTTLISELMQNSGRLAAVEKAKSRFHHLNANLKEHGCQNVKTYLKDGRRVGPLCPAWFDRILLDTPCSSESRFRNNQPSTYQYWNLKKIKAMQHKQFCLLESAVKALKPGGTLVYSTCTFAPEENEININSLLQRYPQMQLAAINRAHLPLLPSIQQWDNTTLANEIQNTLRTQPTNLFDGFFVAKMTKSVN